MVNPKSTASTKRTATPKKATPAKGAGTKKAKAATPAKTKATAKKAKAAAPAKTPATRAGRGAGKAAATKKPPARKPEVPAKKGAAKAASSKTAPPRKKVEPAKAPAKTKAAAAAASKAAPAAADEEAARPPIILKVPPRKPGSVICPLSGWEVMPAKPGLSDRTLKRLRAHLIEERDQQLRQAEELAAEAEELAQERDPGDTQFDEESGEGDTINVERERDLLLSATARQIVDAIDRALARMDAGTYGLCLPAGRKLSLERLEAIPYAEECVDCKARAERRR
jgi:RNA polymerase-binding transcription factor DksA